MAWPCAGLDSNPFSSSTRSLRISQAYPHAVRLDCLLSDRPFHEQRQLRGLIRPAAWNPIVSVVEQAKGEKWAEFRGWHGDWGPDTALWLGRRRGRLSLAELGVLAGGMDYAAVGQAVKRFGQRLEKEAELPEAVQEMESRLSNV